jgi:hypothetical protein
VTRRWTLGTLALAAALWAPAAQAVEYHDPTGFLRLPLDVSGTTACIVMPEPMREPGACRGVDVEAARAAMPQAAGSPSVTLLLDAVITQGVDRYYLGVARFKVENDTQSFMREIMRGARGAVRPPAVILDGADAAPQDAMVGGVPGYRDVLRVDQQPGSTPARALTIVTEAFQGVGCFYTLQLTFAARSEAAGFAYEKTLVAGLKVERPPAGAAADGETPEEGNPWPMLAVGGAGAVLVAAIFVALRRRRQQG